MGKINLQKALIGGLVAGVVLYVIDYLAYGVVFAKDFPLPAGVAGLFGIPILVWFFIVDALYGIALVYLYAAVRPRFGAGQKTAVIAGLLMWVIAGLLHALGEAPMGMAPHQVYTIGTLISFVQLPLAALAGAKFYTEAA